MILVIPALIGAAATLGSAYMQQQQAKKNAAQMNTAGMFGGPRVRPMMQQTAAAAQQSPTAGPATGGNPIGSDQVVAPPVQQSSKLSSPAQSQGNPFVARFAQLLAQQKRGGGAV